MLQHTDHKKKEDQQSAASDCDVLALHRCGRVRCSGEVSWSQPSHDGLPKFSRMSKVVENVGVAVTQHTGALILALARMSCVEMCMNM